MESLVLEGTIIKKCKDTSGTSAKGRQWTKRVFVLKRFDNSEEIYCSTFGKFDLNLIGQNVQFQAEYNPKYPNNYGVKGDIGLSNATPSNAVATAVEEPPPTVEETTGNLKQEETKVEPKRRGRPKKAVATTPVEPGPTSSEAVELVRENLKEAEELLFVVSKKGYTIVDIIAVGDMIGRTKVGLKIEAGKDRRMANFKK